MGAGWPFRSRPASTALVGQHLRLGASGVTLCLRSGGRNLNTILAPPSPARHPQQHPWETPAGLARSIGVGDWRRPHPAPPPGGLVTSPRLASDVPPATRKLLAARRWG